MGEVAANYVEANCISWHCIVLSTAVRQKRQGAIARGKDNLVTLSSRSDSRLAVVLAVNYATSLGRGNIAYKLHITSAVKGAKQSS